MGLAEECRNGAVSYLGLGQARQRCGDLNVSIKIPQLGKVKSKLYKAFYASSMQADAPPLMKILLLLTFSSILHTTSPGWWRTDTKGLCGGDGEAERRMAASQNKK